MIPGLESIPESDFLHFSEIYYSDSNSDSGKKSRKKSIFFTVSESIPGAGIDSKIWYLPLLWFGFQFWFQKKRNHNTSKCHPVSQLNLLITGSSSTRRRRRTSPTTSTTATGWRSMRRAPPSTSTRTSSSATRDAIQCCRDIHKSVNQYISPQKFSMLGASIYDVCEIVWFFTSPHPCHCNKSADFVPFSCFLGTPSPTHIGRHLWKPLGNSRREISRHHWITTQKRDETGYVLFVRQNAVQVFIIYKFSIL